MKTFKRMSTRAALIFAVPLALLWISAAATAQTFTTLMNFGSMANITGIHPAELVQGSDGTLYGTTSQGQGNVTGTVFKIQPDGSGFTVLKWFTWADGVYPGTLTLDGNTLYGTLSDGEFGIGSAVYRVNTDGTGYTVLKHFTFRQASGLSGLALSGSTLYGAIVHPGVPSNGTVYRMNTDGKDYTELKNFMEGETPSTRLALFGSTLYGTTADGGSLGAGTVFKLNTDGSGYTVLKHFGGNDGRNPYAGLTLSGEILYGTTSEGGSSDRGTAYKVNTDGSGYTVLKHFGGSGGTTPLARLTLFGSTLYGTTAEGGSSNFGTVFKVNTDGSGYTVLKHFTGSDGRNPFVGVTLSGRTLYGTTFSGGSSGKGTVFKIELPGTHAATHYVNVSNPSPAAPYTNWATAANVIQDAADLAQPGDEIVVTNGVYETGGRVVHGSLTNRVAVTKALILRSVNGPEATVIRGYQMPGTTNGDAAVRCVYLTNGATLVGFTLTGGATGTNEGFSFTNLNSGGGVWCESRTATLSNCVVSGNAAFFQGGGAYRGVLNHCRLLSNQASGSPTFDPDDAPGTAAGGGAFGAELNNCVLSNNTADFGGGASESTLHQCTLVANRSKAHGGGVGNLSLGRDFVSTLSHCLVVSNVAGGSGGGAFNAVMRNCLIAHNTARNFGGGAFGRTLDNCLVFANQGWVGGGVFIVVGCELNNCTLTGNSASVQGGGVASDSSSSASPPPRLYNCVVYFNSAPVGANWAGWDSPSPFNVAFHNSCTVPLPSGTGSITNAPLFVDPAADDFRLQPNSPCINAGLNAYAPEGPDLNGSPRISGGTVDMGAYEFQSPQSMISYAWLQQYGLPTDGSGDFTDADNDGLNALQEWRAGTDPTNSFSVLTLLTPSANGSVLRLQWRSVRNRTYILERSGSATGQPPFVTLATGIAGQPNTTAYDVTNGVDSGPFFYRVGVRE